MGQSVNFAPWYLLSGRSLWPLRCVVALGLVKINPLGLPMSALEWQDAHAWRALLEEIHFLRTLW